MSARTFDAIVIGDGIIGLASALAVARSGASCAIVGRTVAGAASAASAGLLAPSIGSANEWFRNFMVASRDRYPTWVRWLTERTGRDITLNRLGIIDLSASTAPTAEVLDASTLRSLDPSIGHEGPAVLFRNDGYVDNVQLLAALRIAANAEPAIATVTDQVLRIDPQQVSCTVITQEGLRLDAAVAVVAAGAWSPSIGGIPRAIPVEPVRGQMLQLDGCPLRHAVSLESAYLVPRGGFTLVGSTLERVGFEATTTSAAIEMLHQAAAAAIPALSTARVHGAWAGLRPMTPDGMPLIGRDPDRTSVVYACGHGKNGILLAPITAECVAALVTGAPAEFDLAGVGFERFDHQ